MRLFLVSLLLCGISLAERATPTLEESRRWLVARKALEKGEELESRDEIMLVSQSPKVNDEDLRYLIPLCGLKNITRLDLRGNDIRGPGLARLKRECGRFESIRTVDLADNHLDDGALGELAIFPNLDDLNVDDNAKITGAGLAASALPKLRSLWLAGCPLSSAGVDALARLESVTELHLMRTKLDDSAIAKLNRGITFLDLSSNPLTDEGLAKAIDRFPLRALRVSHTKVTWEGLRASLPRLRKLTELSLGGLKLGKRTPELVELLTPLGIKTLSLKMNGLDWDALLPVAKLGTLEVLHVIDLDHETGDKNPLDLKQMSRFHDYRKSLRLKPVKITF